MSSTQLQEQPEASKLTETDISTLEELFQRSDVDKTGKISIDSVQFLLKEFLQTGDWLRFENEYKTSL